MTQCGSPADTAVLSTIAQDDWGGATWARGGARRYWNANPGFEKDFSYWARSSTTSITVGSSYAYTGNRGVRMASSGNWLYMTSVYDPYHPPGNQVVPGMSTSPTLRVFGNYRHAASSTTGGVKVQQNRRYLRYNQETFSCKRDADHTATHTAWSGVTDLKTCGDPGTTWAVCDGSIVVTHSTTNDATVFRPYIRSTSSAAVYVDKVGAYGGA